MRMRPWKNWVTIVLADLTPAGSTAFMKAVPEHLLSHDGRARLSRGVSDEVVCTIDLYGSLAALTGGEIPEDGALDSLDVHGALLGEEGAKGRTELVQQDNGSRGNFGFRSGDWKLQRHDSKKARNVVVEKLLENTEVPKFQLFDLSKDPAEKKNVIADHPEKAEN